MIDSWLLSLILWLWVPVWFICSSLVEKYKTVQFYLNICFGVGLYGLMIQQVLARSY